ncbi:MAG: ice-binding family protein, partial [Solirubrobacteraceae bacterium]
RPLRLRGPAAGASTVPLFVLACLVALALLASDAVAAQPPVGLGTADSFAVLAGQTVTNTGPSTVNGDLGVTPGAAVPGFPPGTVNGTIHAADAVALQAQSDLTTAYNDAAGRTPPALVSADLGGLTLTSGVYKSAKSLGLTGALTLDAQGDPNAVFIFQAGSTLITASASHVNLINGAQPCNVYWQVGSSATLGTTSAFAGNILALTSVSLNNGVTLNGRALARNGAVTLINDTITAPHCSAGASSDTPGGGQPGGGQPGATPSSNQNGTAVFTTVSRSVATTVARFGTTRCVDRSFRAVVTGLMIRRVVFSVGSHVITTRNRAPFEALVPDAGGIRTVSARVTFTDGTRPATLKMRFKACAAAARRVVPRKPRTPDTPTGFTG